MQIIFKIFINLVQLTGKRTDSNQSDYMKGKCTYSVSSVVNKGIFYGRSKHKIVTNARPKACKMQLGVWGTVSPPVGPGQSPETLSNF